MDITMAFLEGMTEVGGAFLMLALFVLIVWILGKIF